MKRENSTFAEIIRVVCLLALWVATATSLSANDYLGPVSLIGSQDGRRLFVANADAKQIAVVDIANGNVIKTIPMPATPTDLVLGPNGAKLYVTCAASKSTVVVLDTASGKKLAAITTGHTAMGPIISRDGKTLYVCNRFDNVVAVIDLATGKETARVPVTRQPIAASITPDGKTVLVANHIPADRADGNDIAAVVTAIDTTNNATTTIRLPNGSTSLRNICISPDGRFAFTAHILGRYQLPTTQVERGWINSNAMSVVDVVGKKLLNTVLLDDVEMGAANPWGVTCSPDGSSICVTHAGTHELSIIDARALLKKLGAAFSNTVKKGAIAKLSDLRWNTEVAKDVDSSGDVASATGDDVPNDLAYLVGMRRRVSLHGNISGEPVDRTKVNGPRGVVVIGAKAYAAVYFSDKIAVVDLKSKQENIVSTIALGPQPKLTTRRRGEINFHDGTLCFQRWQSCSSCHPDGRADGLNRDLLNDGMGTPKNVKNLLLAHKTPPAMITATIPNAEGEVRAGIAHILFSVRPEHDAVAIDEYLKSLQPTPSPYLVDGKLSASAERGEALFFSEKVGCSECHSKPLYTDQKLHDVDSKGKYDQRKQFDTPTLIECWRTAPYLHDGRFLTVKELLVGGKHSKKVQPLSEDQVNDLIEFVLSL